MSNGSVSERSWKLFVTANKLVRDGKRDADSLFSLLQTFVEERQAKIWQTWKTINLGTSHQTVSSFRRAISKEGMKISDGSNNILDKPAFTISVCKMEVELVLVSVAELGFKGCATLKDIYIRAQELGLILCPSEVGPQLLLQYMNQPKGGMLIIAMEPVVGSDNIPSLFCVTHGFVSRFLDICIGLPGGVWRENNRFVFLRSK